MHILFLCLGVYVATIQNAAAEEWDKYDQEALEHTKQMLANPAAREAASKDNADAKRVYDQVKKLSNGSKQKEDEMYQLASEAFEKIAREEGGDEQKIQARLQSMLQDPAKLGQYLDKNQKNRLRSVASDKK